MQRPRGVSVELLEALSSRCLGLGYGRDVMIAVIRAVAIHVFSLAISPVFSPSSLLLDVCRLVMVVRSERVEHQTRWW